MVVSCEANMLFLLVYIYYIYSVKNMGRCMMRTPCMLMLSKEGLKRKQLIYLSILNYFISSVAGKQ